MCYFMCYKYAATNKRIKVLTGRMLTAYSNNDALANSQYESKVCYDELMKDIHVRDYLRKDLSEQDPMA